MKHGKRITYISLLVISLTLTSCSSERSGVEKNETLPAMAVDVSEDAVTLDEVRACLEEDIRLATQEYDNLKLENVVPIITNRNKVYDIQYYQLDTYKDIQDEKEMYDEQMKLIKYYLGDNLKKEYFVCDYTDVEGKYHSFEEFEQVLQQGEKLEPVGMAYFYETKDDIQYAELQRTLANVFFYRGEVYRSIPIEAKQKLEGATQARFLCDTVAEYDTGRDEERFDDTYQLKDKEISIREGIDFVEEFLNDKLGIEGNDDIKLKVIGVEVIKITDEYYCYRYKIVREINGLLKVHLDEASPVSDVNISYDMSDAYMIYSDEVDMYFGRTRRLNYDLKNETDRIITLGKALELISDNIGYNSNYQVAGITLGYLDILTDNGYGNEGIMTASWVIEAINELDNSITEFYVNARNGEIKVYTRYS